MKIIKQLWLAVTLIVAASLLLLISDWGQRVGGEKAAKTKFPQIAIMQITSTPLLDSHVAGVLDRLESEGLVAPDRKNLHLYNPQGDYPTANAIAREIVNSKAELVITSSTVALQVFSKANVSAQKPHVFGAVTDPYGAGVGISGKNPEDHPPYLAGIGTFQPVERAFQIAREMNPQLKKVGVVWNAGEQCSEACMVKARAICKELGIELLEAVVGNTSEVSEGARSLIARGAEAIWIGGDTVASASVKLLVSLAKQAGIPVFTNDPSDASHGALFGVGGNYFTVGQYTADVAVAILRGKSPAEFRIENVVPELLKVNDAVLASLEKWQLTPALLAVLQEQSAKSALEKKPEPGKIYRVNLLYYAPAPIFEIAADGFKNKMKHLGFEEGKNLKLTIANANTDMTMLNQLVKSSIQAKPDVLVALSTPVLVNVLAQTQDIPVVFGIVTAPLEAGIGESFENHLPNVTGIHYNIPTKELFDRAMVLFPKAKKIGVLYDPAQANSQKELKIAGEFLKPSQLALEAVAVSSTAEVAENIHALLSKNVDIVWMIGDNVVANGLPSVVKACNQKGIPIIADESSLMGSGVLLSCGPGAYLNGEAVAKLTARILLGESPKDIPITPAEHNELAIDFAAMQKTGIQPNNELLLAADKYYNAGKFRGAPAKVAIINLVENKPLDDAIEGVQKGIEASGFQIGKDFLIKKYSAQGDIAHLVQIIDAAAAERPDVIVTVTTPAQAATIKRVKEIPVVFTVASDPYKQGLFTKESRPANVCGVHDDPPVDEVLTMAQKYVPGLKKIGTIYDAAQVNSVLSVEKLRAVTKERHIELLEVTASTVPDLTMATRALIQRGAQALIFSADNLVNTGFSVIAGIADAAEVPTFTTEPDLVEQQATGAFGDSFYDWGVQSGKMAAKVLAGVSPADLPVEKTKVQRRIEPKPKKSAHSQNNKPWKLRIVLYSETEFAERCHDGLLDGFKNAGLLEGKDYELKTYNAQGDMSTLSSIMTAVKSDQVDLLIPISTPALQAALRMAGTETKIVFTGVGDGVQAGAGKSETEHLPNVTGITTRSPFDGMARVIKETLPNVKTVGTLFTPAEINSVLYKDWFKEALETYGIALLAVPVTSSADVAQAAGDLCGKDIQLVAQVVDNLTRPGFALIARKAAENGLPVYVFDSAQMKDGGTICIARDYYDAGLEAADKAVRVLRGENPAEIPFNNTQSEKYLINYDLIQKYAIQLPDYLKDKATPYTIPEKGE
jgi:ABC-type uncharacterized transport system substrate-binding protein